MKPLRTCFVVLTLAGLAACQPKAATETPADTSPAIATVNGSPISRAFYDFYIKGMTGKPTGEVPAQVRSNALDNLIRAKVVGEQAVKDGVDKNPDTAYLLQLTRLQVLEQAMQDRYLKDRPATESELRAEYETQLGQMSKVEYHTRNILVATEPFADKVVQRLDKGEKFEDVAKSASMDPSKSNGGDLPWMSADRMPPEYAAAVLALKSGEYTHKPVHTQYGWHVVQLVETRDVAPPAFEQVRQRLEQMVQSKKFKSYMDELLRGAKIEKFDQAATAPAPAGGLTPAPAPAAPAATPPASGTPPPSPAPNK
jgi:peptidyl-prolyl cis-trans isomerase C